MVSAANDTTIFSVSTCKFASLTFIYTSWWVTVLSSNSRGNQVTAICLYSMCPGGQGRAHWNNHSKPYIWRMSDIHTGGIHVSWDHKCCCIPHIFILWWYQYYFWFPYFHLLQWWWWLFPSAMAFPTLGLMQCIAISVSMWASTAQTLLQLDTVLFNGGRAS